MHCGSFCHVSEMDNCISNKQHCFKIWTSQKNYAMHPEIQSRKRHRQEMLNFTCLSTCVLTLESADPIPDCQSDVKFH